MILRSTWGHQLLFLIVFWLLSGTAPTVNSWGSTSFSRWLSQVQAYNLQQLKFLTRKDANDPVLWSRPWTQSGGCCPLNHIECHFNSACVGFMNWNTILTFHCWPFISCSAFWVDFVSTSELKTSPKSHSHTDPHTETSAIWMHLLQGSSRPACWGLRDTAKCSH